MKPTEKKWIDSDDIITSIAGSPGFLVEIIHQGCAPKYSLRDCPAKTNRSCEAMFDGWCGETNNTNVNADGIWLPVRTSPNGSRVLIERVTKAEEIEAYLELVGYPELIPE